ncbi:hypothetical protein F5148DRAFT_1161508 [Russula earlei]|uniref:Uncharacterized protein n=1 Tax=Russula earlei TaxID=71964 RepID=A0ACC0UND4_9AGAM|nr:hypothetical protein F5148DRAFT_1161508 [Russula earlei]
MDIVPKSGLEERRGQLYYRQATIEKLNANVLLEIFDFSRCGATGDDWWHTLVHVCRRWRHVIFGSSHRLNLRLVCTQVTPVKKMLDVWPALPLVIVADNRLLRGVDNIISALENRLLNYRVCEIHIADMQDSSLLQRFAGVMQEPFPALTCLECWSINTSVPVLPNSFLGGDAPRLRTLRVLRKLPLSSPDLVNLHLSKMSYISPKAMVKCLSGLNRLETVHLGFHSPLSRPDPASRLAPPPTRVALLNVTSLSFSGVSEYLEDLVAQIDIPLLDRLSVTFFNQLIFDVSQLPQLIGRIERFNLLERAIITFSERLVKVSLAGDPETADHTNIELGISCTTPEWQVSSIAQICSSYPFSTLERLDVCPDGDWPPDMESTQWLELLHPFTSVKKMYLSKEFGPYVTPTIRELNGVAEILPALESLFLLGFQPSRPVQESIKQFVAERQLSGQHVIVYDGRSCPFPNCERSFGRRQELERHVLQHLPLYIYCPLCNWRGSRRYALRVHLQMKHGGFGLLGSDPYTIFDARLMAKLLLNGEVTPALAEETARSLTQEKATQLGMIGHWD